MDLAENGKNADHAENIYNMASTLLKIGCKCFGPYGAIAEAGLTIFDTLTAIGESSESEVTQLQNHLDEKFDEVDFHLDDIQKDISELSKKTDEQTRELLNALSDALNALNAQQELTKFMSSRDGNFDYTLFKECLYASANPESDDYSASAYYYKLMDAELNGASDEVVKQCFDNLYKHLNASDNRTERTPVEKLFDYMMKNDYGTESIQYYYYEFLNENRDMLDYEIPAFEALNFTLDLYQTALLADYCIEYCNAYQILHMQNYGGEYRYYFGSGDNDYVTYDDIVAMGNAIDLREEKLFNQILSDMTAFFRIGESYTVKSNGNTFYVSSTENAAAFGNVQNGETVYLNQYLSNYCSIFGLDESKFEFTFSEQGKTPESRDGYYTVDLADGSSFIGSVSYDGIPLYSISFTVGNNNEFGGGSGTLSDPYIISNAQQFFLIYNTEDNYKKHYKLSQSIDLGNAKLTPMFDKLYAFEGSFDGNGYTVSNFFVTDAENCSLFGYIGSEGAVYHLTLSNCKFSLTSTVNDSLYVGAFSGKNEGFLYDCHLVNCTSNLGAGEFSLSLHRETTTPNKYVYSFVGGIAGENKGNVSYCSVDNVTVSGYSKFEYQTNSDGKNKQDLYIGGIVGRNSSGKVEFCYAGPDTKLSGDASSIMTANTSSRHPTILMYVGGIVGKSNATVANVYSDVPTSNFQYKTYVKNTGWTRYILLASADKNNVEENHDPLVASYNDSKNEEIKAANREETKPKTKTLSALTYEFNCEKYLSNRAFYIDQVYEYGEIGMKTDRLWLKNGEEYLDYSVLGSYGFNTDQTSFTDKDGKRTYGEVQSTVTLLVYVEDYGVITSLDVPILIQKVKPVQLLIESLPIYLTYEYSEVKDGFTPSLTGAFFKLLYADGYREDVTSEVKAQAVVIDRLTTEGLQNVKFDEEGKVAPQTQKATVAFGSFTATFDVFLRCSHDWETDVVDNHCEHLGYAIHTCFLCGAQYKDNYSAERLPHNLMIYNADSAETAEILGYQGFRDSTCSAKGYSGDRLCTICGKILEKGTEIDYKNHTFDKDHGNGLVHICTNCGYDGDTHYYRTVEGDTEVRCECIYCHVTRTYAANSRSAIENLPRIIVSDAYALEGQSKVTVFVELHGNVGVTSAYFSVKFPEGFTPDSYSLGNILNTSDVIEFHEYSDRLNVILANKDADTTKRGTLLKLVFVLPETAVIGDEFTVSIAGHKMTADREDSEIEFLTFDGTVTVVDRLPGDVNGDGTVDLMDAVLIAKYTVTDSEDRDAFTVAMKETYEDFDMSYGDVSLDTLKDGTDIVKILRYIVGGYDVQLWSNEFKVLLEYCDFETPQGTIEVSFNNGTGTYGDSLIEVERAGFRFDGWYTDRNYSTKVTDESKVSVNRNQIKQTLYAHYTLNRVEFDGNTSTDGEKQSIGYGDYPRYTVEEDYVSVDAGTFTKTSEITFYHGGVLNRKDVVEKNHSFLGWATSPDGTVDADVALLSEINGNGYITSIDLKKSGYDGLGNVTLYAIWSVERIDGYSADQNVGYKFFTWESTLEPNWDGTGTYLVTSDATFSAKWFTIQYVIYYNGNGGTASEDEKTSYTDNITRYVGSVNSTLTANSFRRPGYEFDGWSLVPDGELKYGNVANIGGYIENEEGGVANLYARWKPWTYLITYNINIPTNALKVWKGQIQYEVINISDWNLPEQEKYEVGRTYQLAEYSEKFDVPGWTFVGWSIDKEGKETIYPNQAQFTNIILPSMDNQSVTLYAIWEVNPYEVGQNVSDGVTVTNSQGTVSYQVFNQQFPRYIGPHSIVDLSQLTVNNLTYYSDAWRPIVTDFCGDDIYVIGNSDYTFVGSYICFLDMVEGKTLTVHMKDFHFTSSFERGVINNYYSSETNGGYGMCEGGTVVLDIHGNCSFTSTRDDGSSATILLEKQDLVFTGDGNLTVKGGDGANATTAGGNGSDGEIAIIVDNLFVNTECKLTVIGGNGGNGADGIAGTRPTDYDDCWGTRNATGGGADGSSGGDGSDGGNGGKGAYAIQAKSIVSTSDCFVANGGNSGFGGAGGSGGAGGVGQEAGGWGKTAGDGGNGGNGGNGGSVYHGSEALNCSEITGNIVTVSGKNGVVGEGGSGGSGGSGGHHSANGGHGQWATWGNNGKDGDNGEDGDDGDIME